MNRTPYDFLYLAKNREKVKKELLENLKSCSKNILITEDFTLFFDFDKKTVLIHYNKIHPKYADFIFPFDELASILTNL